MCGVLTVPPPLWEGLGRIKAGNPLPARVPLPAINDFESKKTWSLIQISTDSERDNMRLIRRAMEIVCSRQTEGREE